MGPIHGTHPATCEDGEWIILEREAFQFYIV